jgi:hypothetical protein
VSPFLGAAGGSSSIFIGTCFQKLDLWLSSFSLEVSSSILTKDWVGEALKSTGRESQRRRKLTAGFTVWLVIAIGFYRSLSIKNVVSRMGNLLGIGSLWSEGREPASSSIVEARERLGLAPFRLLVERLREWFLERHRASMTWKGFLLLALDGSTLKLPDTPQHRKRFGLPATSRGRAAFPQMRALFLVSTRLHFILKGLFAPYHRSENELAIRMLPWIPERSLVIVDRLFGAWMFLLGVVARGCHFLVRAKKNMNGVCLQVLGRGDRLIEMKLPRARRREHPELPKSVVLREISARIKGKPYRFFTSLLDAHAFPARELVARYADRWEEEIALDEIKIHQCATTTVNRPVIFRCQTSRLALQEAHGLILAYNLIRALIAEAAERFHVPPLRISFLDALVRIRDAALVMAMAPTRWLPSIFEDLLRSLSRCLLPPRRARSNPRAVCVKMSSYPLKKKSA